MSEVGLPSVARPLMQASEGWYRYGATSKVGSFPSPEQPQLMQPQACGRTLTLVALSERDAHPGFQIALEGDCPPLVGEFDDDVDLH